MYSKHFAGYPNGFQPKDVGRCWSISEVMMICGERLKCIFKLFFKDYSFFFFLEMLDKGADNTLQTWSLKRWNYSAGTTETAHAC